MTDASAGVRGPGGPLERLLRPGDTVFVGTGIGEPETLIEDFIACAPRVGGLTAVQVITGGQERLAEASGGGFRLMTPMPGRKARKAIAERRADLLPASMGQMLSWIVSGGLPVDGVLLQAAAPEGPTARPGITVDLGPLAYARARFRALEINPLMPAVGEPGFDLALCDHRVDRSRPLRAIPPVAADDRATAIGLHTADAIGDGTVLELGVGRALAGVPEALRTTRRDLSICSGLIDDGTRDLVEAGTVCRPLAGFEPAVAIGTVAMGTEGFYRWLEDSPLVRLCDSRVVHDIGRLSALGRFAAVNGCLEVDLLGQANSIGIGTRILSGVGGGLDFAGAAARSGGSIVALQATRPDGRSCIVPRLDWVSLPIAYVTHVATEWGCARLSGKSVSDRARAMIGIAHPDHRDELVHAARNAGYL